MNDKLKLAIKMLHFDMRWYGKAQNKTLQGISRLGLSLEEVKMSCEMKAINRGWKNENKPLNG